MHFNEKLLKIVDMYCHQTQEYLDKLYDQINRAVAMVNIYKDDFALLPLDMNN